MKEVKFDLVLKVHDDLKEDELKKSLDTYMIMIVLPTVLFNELSVKKVLQRIFL